MYTQAPILEEYHYRVFIKMYKKTRPLRASSLNINPLYKFLILKQGIVAQYLLPVPIL